MQDEKPNKQQEYNPTDGSDDIFQQYFQNGGLRDAEDEAADTETNESGGSSLEDKAQNALSNIRSAKEKEKEDNNKGTKGSDGNKKGSNHKYDPSKSGPAKGAAGNRARLAAAGKGLLKKRGPLTLILSITLGFGGTAGMLFSTPATLFASVKANITNSRDTSAPARNMRFNRIMASMMPDRNSNRNIDKACEKPRSKMCRALTMSDTMKRKLEKAGLKIESEKSGDNTNGRSRIRSIVAKDVLGREFKADSKDQFRQLFRRPVFRAAFNRGYDAMKSPFLGKHFGALLSKRFGVSRGPGLEGKSKREFDKSFRESMRLEGEPADGDLKKRKDNRKKQNKKSQNRIDSQKIKGGGKGSKLGVLSTICSFYYGVKGTLSAAKLIQITNLVRFASVFLIEFDRVLASESTPEASSYIGNRLNYSEKSEFDADGKPNRFYNTNFTDAEGMRMLLHGDIRNLSEYGQKYVVGGGVIQDINGALSSFEDFIGGWIDEINVGDFIGKLTGRSTDTPRKTGQIAVTALCKGAGVVDQAVELSHCWSVIGAPLATVGTVFPVVGNAIGAAIGLGACYLLISVAQKIIEAIVTPYLDDIVQKIAEWAAEMPLDDETNGFDAGNALAAGAGLLLQNSALTNGLVSTNTAGYKKYLSNVSGEMNEYIAAQQYEAHKTPLDTTNQYSFMGSIALSLYQNGITYQGFNPIKLAQNSLSLLPMAGKRIANISTTANALGGVFNTIAPFNEHEAKCPDPILTDNFSGDPFCVPYTHMAEDALTVDPVELIQYMEDNEFISKEDGSILDTDNGKILKNFNKYCVTRTMPPGELDQGGSSSGDIDKSIDNTEPLDPLNEDVDQLDGEEEETSEDSSWSLFLDWSLEDWQNGYNCSNANEHAKTNEKMLAMLSAYTMDNRIHDDMEDEGSTSGHEKGDGGSGEWARPTTGICTSGYGLRGGQLHAGLDIAPSLGTPILAPTKMRIIYAADKGDRYGNSVAARQIGGEEYMFRFAHANELKVKDGEEVDRGTIIATVGSTGESSGPHLHFEIYTKESPDGAYAENGTPLDPHPILKEHGVDVGPCNPNY